MATRTITIDIQTKANLAELQKLQKGIDTLGKSVKSLSTHSASLTNITKAFNNLSTSLNKVAAAQTKTTVAVKANVAAINASNTATTRAATASTASAAASTRAATATTRATVATTASTAAVTRASIAARAATIAWRATGAAITVLRASLTSLTTIFNGISRIIGTVARLLGSILRSALIGATTAFSTLGRTASSVFSGLQRSLNGITGGVRTFANTVQRHMQTATRSMQQFYNAGWSLLTTGYMARGAGMGMLGGLGNMVKGFMDYEKALTRAAIAGSDIGAGVAADPRGLEEQIFALQRGVGPGRVGAVKAFGADEIAEAMYFYSSAIGTAITDANIGVVRTILQMAASTRTSVETATKGVLNIATEFGLDPRSTEKDMQDRISNIAAQMGYLANISTMEVPDIAETFKMLGPMAHILSNRNVPGAGLEEMMALTFLASEVGLRGGNVGRGVGQALTTLLDPSGPAVIAAAEAFGFEASETAFKSFFFDAEGRLEGGLSGLFKKIADIAPEKQAQALAAIFTQNATRATIGIAAASMGEALERMGGMEGFIKNLQGQNPMEWLTSAADETNKTLFAAWQDTQNAWFQVTTAIVRSIEGTLIPAFGAIAEVLFRVADIIRTNPWIGELVAGIISLTGTILTVVGTFFMLGGSVLLAMKAFSLLGGLFGPAIFFFTSVISSLLILGPLFLGIAAAAVLVKRAWESNLGGIQDRFHALVDAARTWAVWASLHGPEAARAFVAVFEERVFVQFERFQEYLQRNAMYLTMLRRALDQFVQGVQQGFVAVLGTLIAILHNLGEQIDQVLEKFSPTRHKSVDEFIERFNRLQNIMDTTARAMGVTLGAAITLLILRQLVPAIVITGAFRLALLALQAATLLVSASIWTLNAAVTVFTGIVTTISSIGLVASGVTVGILAIAGAFVYLLATSDEFRGQIETIFLAIWNGLEPLRSTLPNAIVGAFALVVFAVSSAVAAISAHAGTIEQAVSSVASFIAVVVQNIPQMIQGMLSVFVPVGEVILTVVAALVVIGVEIGKVALSIVEFIGVGDVFYGLGQSIAALLIGAMAFGLVTMVAGWIAAGIAVYTTIAPLLVVVGLIALLAIALARLGLLDDVFNGLIWGFEAVRWAVEPLVEDIYLLAEAIWSVIRAEDNLSTDAWTKKAGELRAAREEYVQTMLSGVTDPEAYKTPEYQKFQQQTKLSPVDNQDVYRQWLTAQWNAQEGSTNVIEFGKSSKDYAPRTMDPVQFAEWQSKQAAAGANVYFDETKGGWVSLGGKFGKDSGEAFTKSSEKSFFDSLSNSRLATLLEEWGLDPQTFSVSGLIDKIGAEEYVKTYQDAIEGVLGTSTAEVLQKEYNQANDAWETYMGLVEKWGQRRADAFYRANNQPIPTNPGTYEDWASAQVEAVEETEAEILEKVTEMNQSLYNALSQMDLGSALAGMAGGGMTVGQGIFMNMDTIIQNAGSPDWLNSTEVLADVAGMGMLGTSLAGVNAHEALGPALEILSQNTGVAISDLLKGIPKYIVPQEFVPLATTELLNALNIIPRDAYERLDKLGAGEYTEIGLDWAELVEYGIGQAIEGKEWNLVDYLSSSWSESQDVIEQYLRDNMVNPYSITQEIFDDTRLMADMQGGKVNVLSEEWFAWLQAATQNGADQTIEITRAAFEQLPDAVKIGFSNMGYSFVIGAEGAVGDIVRSSELLREGLQRGYGALYTETGDWASESDQQAFWQRIWDDAAADGMINRVGMTVTEFENEHGKFVTIRDEFSGMEVTIPAVQYEAALASAREAAKVADELDKVRQAINDLKKDLEAMPEIKPFTGMNFGDLANAGQKNQLLADLEAMRTVRNELLGITEEGTMQLPDIAPPQNMQVLEEAVTTAITTGFTKGMENLGTDFTIPDSFKTMFDTAFTEIGSGMMAKIMEGVSSPTGGGTEAGAGPFDETFKGYGTTAANTFHAAFSLQFGTHLNRTSMAEEKSGVGVFDTIFAGYGTSAANAFKTAIDTALTGWTPSLGGGVAAPTTAAGHGGAGTPTGGPFDTTFDGWATSALTAFTTGVEPIGQVATDAGTITYTNFSVSIAPIVPNAEAMGAGASRAFGIGISGMPNNMSLVIDGVLGILANAGAAMWNAGYNAGWNAGDGLVAGLNSQKGAVATAAASLANAAAAASAAAFKNASPSKVFIEQGIDVGTGLALGIESTTSQNVATMHELASRIQLAFSPRDVVSSGSVETLSGNGTHRINAGAGAGNVNITVENITIAKEIDIDRAMNRFNELLGRKTELARRGMIAVEDSRSV